MNPTYDVTAVSHGGVRVPLIHSTNYSMAHEIARPRSMDEMWSAVEIRESDTGNVVATYVDGEARFHRERKPRRALSPDPATIDASVRKLSRNRSAANVPLK